ncbi:ABC transporter ATP-binding protein [Bdellovibrio sp. HCB337]|uniref:ABC transporter ATP-binding protein n=1 Tax=Bdellovibrio sp. HCB337 TaxID=3394358 RepID=UPI0039A6FC37
MSQTALKGVSLRIAEGEFFSLLGPSGCGKTTLLRILAGLEDATQGQILLDGKRVDTIPAMRRPFNMVFQRYALFPHMTVEQNIAYGLKLKKVAVDEIHARVTKVLGLVDMASFAKRRPETLSGGQAQRVAIARALVNEPRVLLLDEPLSALDQKLREHMRKELRDLQKQLKLTFVYVTHDQEEAFALSDRIGIMDRGDLKFVGTPHEVFSSSGNSFVAEFIGTQTYLPGELIENKNELVTVRLGDGGIVKGRYIRQSNGENR